MYLLSYRDRCFWRIHDIENHRWRLRMHTLCSALVNEIHDKYSMRAKIIISCSEAQRVFLVFEFDWFFSELSVSSQDQEAGSFRNQPPQEVK